MGARSRDHRYTWSDENYRIFGLRPQERILTFDDVQELLYPADREMRAAAVAEALRGGRRYDVEYRVVRPDGEVRLVRSEGDVVRDEAGRLLRVFGTVQDITERKRGEQRRSLRVFVKENGAWRVTAFHNTRLRPPGAPAGPR